MASSKLGHFVLGTSKLGHVDTPARPVSIFRLGYGGSISPIIKFYYMEVYYV